MVFGSTTRRRRKVCIAPAAFAALRRQVSLARLCKVKKQVVCLRVKNLRSHGDHHNGVFAIFARPVGTLTVPAAFGLMFGVVTKMQERVQSLSRFDPYAAADTAVAASALMCHASAGEADRTMGSSDCRNASASF